MGSGLSAKREEFCQQYLVDLNATQAAIRAGYSRKTARSQGQRLLTNVDIMARIEQLKDERAERTRVTQDKVLTELARLGFSNMRDFMEWGPSGVRIKSSDELSEDDSAAVTQLKFTPGKGLFARDTIELKLGHKDSALRMLAEHVGLFDSTPDPGKLADTFLAGAEAMRQASREVPDLSE